MTATLPDDLDMPDRIAGPLADRDGAFVETHQSLVPGKVVLTVDDGQRIVTTTLTAAQAREYALRILDAVDGAEKSTAIQFAMSA